MTNKSDVSVLRDAFCTYMACPTVRNYDALLEAIPAVCDHATERAAIQPAEAVAYLVDWTDIGEGTAQSLYYGAEATQHINDAVSYALNGRKRGATVTPLYTAPVAVQPAGDAVRDAIEPHMKRCDEMRDSLFECKQELQRMRSAFHVNMLRAFPGKSHEEISAEIDRACAAPVASAPAQPMSLEAERVALPTKESLREAIAEQVSRAEDLMSTFKLHGAKTRYFDAMEATDKIIDQLFAALATQQGDKHE